MFRVCSVGLTCLPTNDGNDERKQAAARVRVGTLSQVASATTDRDSADRRWVEIQDRLAAGTKAALLAANARDMGRTRSCAVFYRKPSQAFRCPPTGKMRSPIPRAFAHSRARPDNRANSPRAFRRLHGSA
jgi:hypothetical protein